MKTLIQKETAGNGRQKLPTPTVTTGSIYVHVPFCTKKCPYCHFFVQPPQDISLYLDGIKREWEMRKHKLGKIVSIYLGGGTPSLLTLSQIEEILTLFPTAEEVTIEANPDDITKETLEGYLALGINRLSIGVQSLDDTELKQIGRTHSANKASNAVILAAKTGFTNISIDLMFDLPSQTLEGWKRTVDAATNLPITHLSIYNLIFEEGSSYYKRQKELKPLVPPEETSLEMLQYAVTACEKAGLHRYEISAFCRNNKESLHNTGYWLGRPFIGLGPSAFSYLDGHRFRNICHLKKWQRALTEGKKPIDFDECLPYPQNLLEHLAIRLRLMRGVDLTEFPELPEETKKALDSLTNRGLIHKMDSHIKLTETGKLFYDLVASELI